VYLVGGSLEGHHGADDSEASAQRDQRVVEGSLDRAEHGRLVNAQGGGVISLYACTYSIIIQ